MTKKFMRAMLLGGVAAAISLQLPAQANAQYLFDNLFGGGNRRPQQPDFPPPPPAPPPAAPKVVGPQYYTYKVDPLVRVDFARLARQATQVADPRVTNSVTTPAAEPAIGGAQPSVVPDPAVDSADFGAALASLADYELRTEKEIAEAILAHYSASPDFIWVSNGQPNQAAADALALLGDAAAWGLDTRDYDVVLPDADASDPLAAAARFEMALSARVLRYVRDAQQGRVDPNRISGYHDFARKPLDWKGILAALTTATDVTSYLEGWHPANPAFAALKSELAELRRSAENDIVIEPKTLIKPGQTNPEFPKVLKVLLRDMDAAWQAEFAVLLGQHEGSETYASELVPAVKAAQKALGLTDDGVIGPRTIATLVGDSKAGRIDKVVVAMEQLRWLPSEFAQRHVFINVPAFRADYVEGGDTRLSMRTVVGTTNTQTFFFQDEIEYVEFNPYWGIPRSILVNKYLPKLYANPGYLDQIGYEVTDGSGRRIPSGSIDWTRYGANPPFDVRQPPGPKNSLGAMKIMFPNEHAIYMHDTPEKHLFQRDSRAYSNGCVRLEDPRAMAAAVLGWDKAAVDGRVAGGQNNRADLGGKVAVYVAYFTAWPNQSGTVEYVPDVYDRDSRVLTAMSRIGEVRVPGS